MRKELKESKNYIKGELILLSKELKKVCIEVYSELLIIIRDIVITPKELKR